jgi:hypothetical protein
VQQIDGGSRLAESNYAISFVGCQSLVSKVASDEIDATTQMADTTIMVLEVGMGVTITMPRWQPLLKDIGGLPRPNGSTIVFQAP